MQSEIERIQLLEQLNFLKDERAIYNRRIDHRDETIRALEAYVQELKERIYRLEESRYN